MFLDLLTNKSYEGLILFFACHKILLLLKVKIVHMITNAMVNLNKISPFITYVFDLSLSPECAFMTF